VTDQLDALLEELAGRVARRLHQLAGDPTTLSEPGSPWMDAKTAAAYLDWPLQRVYKLTAQRAIPHVKHDGRLLFHRGQLDHWLGEYALGDWMLSPERGISR
jgi:excisionase family DNA binding protein